VSSALNMTEEKVDPVKAKGHQFLAQKVSYNRRDLVMYALGVGASELKFLYENDASFSAIPTFPVVLGFKGESSDIVPFGKGVGADVPGIPKFNLNMILHGEQSVEIFRPLPISGSFENRATVLGVFDKGSGAVIETETSLVDPKSDTVFAKMVSSTFVRGLGGFGGEKQPKTSAYSPPKRAADAVEEFKTDKQQAMLYRLSGDYNPLHADPKIATKVGFPEPILHGLCSFGVAARAILKQFAGNDTKKFKGIKVRFAAPVYPGETLVTEMWRSDTKNGITEIIFQVTAKERNVIVINQAVASIAGILSRL